jgi:hypothetical protein
MEAAEHNLRVKEHGFVLSTAMALPDFFSNSARW